jgi:type III pantothenate kinase
MNAAVDIGNTNVKIGLFRQSKLLSTHETNLADLIRFFDKNKTECLILSTVKPVATEILERIQPSRQMIVLNASTPLPIGVNYKTPETLGADRLAAAVGSLNYYRGNKLIVDLGSCITYDLVDKDQVFQGGLISPGVNMRLKAMHEFTAGLPLVDLQLTQDLTGKTTEECVLSGALNGTLAEINQVIYRYFQQFDDLRVIICGGGAVYFDKKMEIDTFVVPNLVLEGLNSILRFNVID